MDLLQKTVAEEEKTSKPFRIRSTQAPGRREKEVLLLFSFSHEFYFQIPECIQKGGNVSRGQTLAPAYGHIPDRHL